MKQRHFVLGATVIAILNVAPIAGAQERETARPVLDGSDINRQLAERQEKIEKLSPAERKLFEAAGEAAREDPVVQAALAKREQAIREFQDALWKSIVQADPSLALSLTRMAGPSPSLAPEPTASPAPSPN